MRNEDYCITPNFTILEAIEAIKRTRHRGVIVINESNKVCGFVSQGDILEAIIEGHSLYAQISSILRPSFIYATDTDLGKVITLFKAKLITILPIVNEEFELIDVIKLSDVFDYLCTNGGRDK